MMSKRKNRIPNIYVYLLVKFLLAFFALMVVQAVFIIVNHDLCQVEDSQAWWNIIWGNVVFGLATVSGVLLPYFVLLLLPIKLRWKRWYRVICEILYFVAVVLLTVPALSDSIYYQHTLRLLSSDIFHYLTVGGQMGTLTWMFLADFWPVTLTGVLLLILVFIVGVKMKWPERDSWRSHTANDWTGLAVGMVLLCIMVRGGFGGHFIQLSDAAKYTEPKNTVLVSNSIYSIIRTFGVDELPPDYMDDHEASKLFSTDFRSTPIDSTIGCDGWRAGAGVYAEKIYDSDSAESERQEHKNVVLVVLESFSQEYMGCYGAEHSYTPFLDSLATVSYLYDGRSNGKKSIEGIAAIVGSRPTLTFSPYTLSDIYDSSAVSLASILRNHGYSTAFYHGTYNGVMNFDVYCRDAGFDAYYGKNEYLAEGRGDESDYDGVWGIFDEPFLQYSNRVLSATKEPFFSVFFTVTSHHPFPIPEQHKEQFKSARGENPLLKCVSYTDYSLRRFFEAASKESWYNHTLFIILADHPGYALSKPYTTLSGLYRIPFMVYDPTCDMAGRSNRIVQQADVMPTVLDYLGFTDRCTCFGTSLFRSRNGFQVAFGNGFYQFVRDNGSVATICGQHEDGSEADIKILKAYLQNYRDVMKADD